MNTEDVKKKKENDFICKHKIISVGDDLYEWCRYCGIIIYHYEDYKMVPAEDVLLINGTIKYNKHNSIIHQSRIVNPQNLRVEANHKHDFFVLSATDAWCKECGTLRLKRQISPNGFKIELKEGFLMPQRRISCLEIRSSAGMSNFIPTNT